MLQHPLLTTSTAVTGDYLITPAVCSDYLERNSNRPVRQAKVDTFGVAMIEGRWQLTGQPIIISKTRRLLTGQHRLLACVKYNVPFVSHVVFGIDDDAFIAIDTGTPYSMGDRLVLSGTELPRTDKWFTDVVMSVNNMLLAYDREGVIAKAGRLAATPEELMAFYLLHRELDQSTIFASSNRIRLIPPTIVALMHYLGSFRAGRKAETENFLLNVKAEFFPSKTDPSYILFKALRAMEQRNKGSEPGRNRPAAPLCLKALRLSLDGKKIKKLEIKKDELLPQF